MEERIIEFLEQQQGPVKPAEIADKLGLPEQVVSNGLYPLSKDGRIGPDINNVVISDRERLRRQEDRNERERQRRREDQQDELTELNTRVAQLIIANNRTEMRLKIIEGVVAVLAVLVAALGVIVTVLLKS
jgi:DNA-binding Lrp family transcriptional regulator